MRRKYYRRLNRSSIVRIRAPSSAISPRPEELVGFEIGLLRGVLSIIFEFGVSPGSQMHSLEPHSHHCPIPDLT